MRKRGKIKISSLKGKRMNKRKKWGRRKRNKRKQDENFLSEAKCRKKDRKNEKKKFYVTLPVSVFISLCPKYLPFSSLSRFSFLSFP
jgi:hypothetical protein